MRSWDLFICILGAVAATGARAQAAQLFCGIDVVMHTSIPEGKIFFSRVSDSVVKIDIMKFDKGSDYIHWMATTSVRLSDEYIVEERGNYLVFVASTLSDSAPAFVLDGVAGIEALLNVSELAGSVRLTSDEGHVGFEISLPWSYQQFVQQPPVLPEYFQTAEYDKRTGSESAIRTTLQEDITSVRPGYQWYISPVLAVKLDKEKTVEQALRCPRRTTVLIRTQNPPRPTVDESVASAH